jgi:hypothetical protein
MHRKCKKTSIDSKTLRKKCSSSLFFIKCLHREKYGSVVKEIVFDFIKMEFVWFFKYFEHFLAFLKQDTWISKTGLKSTKQIVSWFSKPKMVVENQMASITVTKVNSFQKNWKLNYFLE